MAWGVSTKEREEYPSMSIHLILTSTTSIHPCPHSSNTQPFSSKADVHPPREWQRRDAEGAFTAPSDSLPFLYILYLFVVSSPESLTLANAVPHSSPRVANSINSSDLLLAFLLSENNAKLSRPVGIWVCCSALLLVVSIMMVSNVHDGGPEPYLHFLLTSLSHSGLPLADYCGSSRILEVWWTSSPL